MAPKNWRTGAAMRRSIAAPVEFTSAAQPGATRYKIHPTINRTGGMTAEPEGRAVTGAARGIGLAVAKRFLAEGWCVALLDIEGELLHGALAALARPDPALALHCDVSDAAAVATAVDAVEQRFGRLDALVNNAGIARVRSPAGNHPSRTGAGCWRSISPGRSCAPRPRCR